LDKISVGIVLTVVVVVVNTVARTPGSTVDVMVVWTVMGVACPPTLECTVIVSRGGVISSTTTTDTIRSTTVLVA